jgi:muramoyltetrapeptide carboxypeptidase
VIDPPVRSRSAIAPPRVRRGQLVGIVAPAGPVRVPRLELGLGRLSEVFALRLAPSLTGPRAPATPSYLAASDEVRAAELSAMLADPDVRAVICARGGYGVMRILPALDPDLLRRDPKPIVGFSDATALLSWAHRAGVRGIHGPMVEQLGGLPAADLGQLVALLTDPRPPGERPWSLAPLGGGIARGPLVPANLTLASLLVGTRWALPLAGAIALFEEVGERPYELDRYVTQLALTGALAEVAAVVIGELTPRRDPAGDDPDGAGLAAVRDRLAAAGVAVVAGAPIGHGARNEAVPFGAHCELDLARGVLAITEGAVA